MICLSNNEHSAGRLPRNRSTEGWWAHRQRLGQCVTKSNKEAGWRAKEQLYHVLIYYST